LGLSSQYDLKSAQAALKLAVDSNKLVWIDLSQGALRTSGLMGKMVDISKLARQRNAQIGWVIPEDDPFWSIADYEPWLMEMKQAGASIALGGFGLGYSSLSKLGVGAWSVIRLHESLTNIGDSESLGSHAKIVRASLSLCAALGIQAACVMPKNDKARKMIMEMAKQVGCKPLWLGASESHRIESKGG
jgi:EAL domain-containing protein (putative c-di-GMP-specific phosphodiesterase class I)